LTMPPKPNETELVSRAQNGDRNAFSELVRANAKGVLGVVYRMCGDVQLAEDAAQETFIQAWLKLPSYRPQTSLRNWLYRIAVNNAIDMLRKEKRTLPGALEDLDLVAAEPDPAMAFASKERSEGGCRARPGNGLCQQGTLGIGTGCGGRFTGRKPGCPDPEGVSRSILPGDR